MFQKVPVRAEDLPLFASPCKREGIGDKQREGRSSSTLVFWAGVPVVVSYLLLTLPRLDQAQNRPAAPSAAQRQGGQPHVESTPTARHPLSYYTGGVRSNLFAPPQVKQPKPPPPPKPKPIVVPKPQPPPPPPPVNPFADWSYTGAVTAGDQRMALIENTKTKEGEYVKAGESFQGAQVVSVTDQMVTLSMNGKPSMLAKSDNMELTPMQGAPAASPAGSPPAGAPPPGAPPMPGGMPPGLTHGGADLRAGLRTILPNGQVLSPRQAMRRSGRLNRTF